jgi:hypothetical protein
MSNTTEITDSSKSEVDIRAELNRFRQKLLDLSNLNRLLNYHKSATRTIQIVEELPNQIFERLVIKEKPFSFQHKADPSENEPLVASDGVPVIELASITGERESPSQELPLHPESDRKLAKQFADDRLQTDLSEKRLERTLTTMRQEANAAIQETGVNYLYLALGMLEWRETDGIARTFLAPLILVPLRFERNFDGRCNKFRITASYSGEDIQQNLCLAKRIENDFGIVLPEYRPDEDGAPLYPESYFAQVTQAIASKTEWRIKREALIGFFSFRKLLMYLDLDPDKWKGDNSLEKHPLVRAVIEGSQIDEGSNFYGKDYDVDENETARTIALVKDADSSQHSALCDIAEGKSLVVEGPPGTGKSQTITNAIANALNNGKSVLFVAEKLAALEVVRTNLEKVGLGSFCLELHSEAANPREVFTDLGRRLDTSFQSPRGIESLHSRVESQKAKLQRYLLACRLPAGPHGTPLYDVFWRIVELRSRGVNVLTGAKVDTENDELQFDDAVACLNEIAAHAKELGRPTEIAWHGFFADRLPPSGHRVVANVMHELGERAEQIACTLDELSSRFGGEKQSWIILVRSLSETFLEELVVPSVFDQSFVPFLSTAEQCKVAAVMSDEVRNTKTTVDAARRLVVGDLDATRSQAEELSGRIASSIPESLHSLKIGSLRETRSQLQTARHALEAFFPVASKLCELGFGPIETLRDFDQASYKYRLVSHNAVAPPQVLKENHFLAGALAAFQRGRKATASIEQQATKLEERVQLSKVPEEGDLQEIINVLRAYGTASTRFFRTAYRKCRQQIREFAKKAGPSIRNPEWVTTFEEVRNLRSASLKLSVDEELKRFFGEKFFGVNTDWKSLEVTLSWINTAKKAGLGFHQAAALVTSRWNDRAAPSPTNVVAVGTSVRQELAPAAVCSVMSIRVDAVDVAALSKVHADAATIVELIDRFLELRGSFAANDEITLRQLFDKVAYVWGRRSLNQAASYLVRLCSTGHLKNARSPEMLRLQGRLAKQAGQHFNELVSASIAVLPRFTVRRQIKKFSGKRIERPNGEDLGDVDVLAAASDSRVIFAIEAKSFALAKTPVELANERKELFGELDGKSGAVGRHLERSQWLRDNLAAVLAEIGISDSV